MLRPFLVFRASTTKTYRCNICYLFSQPLDSGLFGKPCGGDVSSMTKLTTIEHVRTLNDGSNSTFTPGSSTLAVDDCVYVSTTSMPPWQVYTILFSRIITVQSNHEDFTPLLTSTHYPRMCIGDLRTMRRAYWSASVLAQISTAANSNR